MEAALQPRNMGIDLIPIRTTHFAFKLISSWLLMAKRGGDRIFHGSANMFPSHLVHNIEGTHPQHMTLRNCNNISWHLKIEKHGDNWYFTSGWSEFAKDNMIKRGDLLDYTFTSKSLLDFEILTSSLGPGGVEDFKVRDIKEVKRKDVVAEEVDVKAEPEEAEHEETAADEVGFADDESEDLEAAADDEADDGQFMDGAGTAQRRKRKKSADAWGSDLLSSGRIRQPDHPYFVTEMKDTRQNELYIPKDIVKGHKIQLPDHMTIVDSKGRPYEATRKRWKDGRAIYIGGWKSVCKVNGALKDDKILCEFVPSDTGALQLKVRFLDSERRQG